MKNHTLEILLLILILAFLPVYGETVMQIACKVNGQAVTDYEIKSLVESHITEQGRYLSPTSEEYMKLSAQVLQSLVNDMLLYQAAELEGIRIPDSVLKQEIERIKKTVNVETDEELVEKLKMENLTMGSLIENIKRRNTVQYFVRQKLEAPVITESDALKYYEENSEDYLKEEALDLSIIMLGPDYQQAIDVYNRITQGEEFEDMARQYSEHASTRGSGGRLGVITKDSLNETFREKLEGKSDGFLTLPFLYEGNHVLLKVNSIEGRSYTDFSEVKDEIVSMLYNRELERKYSSLLKDLMKNSVVEYTMPYYEKAMEKYGDIDEMQ